VVIDATGKISTAVATNAATGAFTVDVAGLTAPFLLQVVGTAGGKQVFLSSVATAAGQTVNLTPLTDLVVSAAAGVAGGGSLVDACAPSGSTAPAACVAALKDATTGSRLSTAVSDVAKLVKDLNTAGTDVLNGAFTANGTGFDALLDKILVTPASSGSPVATVTLIASNTSLGQVALPATSGGTATVTPATGQTRHPTRNAYSGDRKRIGARSWGTPLTFTPMVLQRSAASSPSLTPAAPSHSPMPSGTRRRAICRA
jgi:hypothetical protein